jgi:hypothetical protein
MGSFPGRQILLRQSPGNGIVKATAMIALLYRFEQRILPAKAKNQGLSLSILTLAPRPTPHARPLQLAR